MAETTLSKIEIPERTKIKLISSSERMAFFSPQTGNMNIQVKWSVTRQITSTTMVLLPKTNQLQNIRHLAEEQWLV